MKNYIIVIPLLVLGYLNIQAQDPVFSQFYSTGLYLNPALSGLEKDVVLGMNYRTQWAGVNLPFKTFQFSAIHPIIQQGVRSKHLGGFGASAFSDEAGPNREFVSHGVSVSSSYNFHLNRTGKHIISTALQFGFVQRHINMDNLQWSSQYSSVIGYDRSLAGENLIANRITSPVINAGLIWRLVIDQHYKPMKMFYQGLAISNLNRPRGFYQDSKAVSATLFKLHGGMLQSFRNGLEISPNYLIQYQNTLQMNVGAYAAYSISDIISRSVSSVKVSLGAWYRVKDSFIMTTGIMTPAWNFGFSYDANNSSLDRSFQGANAWEISFAYKISIMKELKKFSSPLF
ncbi:MAG: PorP/SprF family type IX secretion system membrane protein [Cyclobacteriaceae bacterium]